MPGIQPTVEMPCGGAYADLRQLLAGGEDVVEFIVGSPMPMKTRWLTASMRRRCSAWSRISSAVRLRPNFILPVAQNVQVSGQPDCEETQIERRPSS